MAEKDKSTIFRKTTLDRISSPEQLTDYLHVTNPGIWALLLAVLLLLGALFAWASVGTLETTAQARVLVENHTARIVMIGAETLRDGMPLRIASEEYVIVSTGADEYGRSFGIAEVSLPDGDYDGTVVLEQTRPISFLLESRG